MENKCSNFTVSINDNSKNQLDIYIINIDLTIITIDLPVINIVIRCIHLDIWNIAFD